MGKLTDIIYVRPKVTKQWLLSHNFRYNRSLSDNESEVYTYRFPVYKYDKFTTLECELYIILGEDRVRINVYDYGTYNKYAPFYYCQYGNYDTMLKTVWKNIDKKRKLLGIIKNNDKEIDTDDGGKNKEIKRKCNHTNKRKQ